MEYECDCNVCLIVSCICVLCVLCVFILCVFILYMLHAFRFLGRFGVYMFMLVAFVCVASASSRPY